MSKSLHSHPLITGTLVLTGTGIISRIIGFFYRIYLSQLFGPENVGIYQLISPILALSFSLTAAGIQTAISKYVAGETITKDYGYSFKVFFIGTMLSFLISIVCAWSIYKNAPFLAVHFLLEERCEPLLKLVALSIPLGAIHSCVNGYFYGLKKTAIPSITQLLEQTVRVVSVFGLSYYFLKKNIPFSIELAVLGLVLGEFVSMLISMIAILHCFKQKRTEKNFFTRISSFNVSKQILFLALPLSANRIVLNFLQSIEAIYIPNKLQAFGFNTSSALSIYGILTGMALPLILFPSALTNSISVLLLPIVSEAEAANNNKKIVAAVSKTIRYCSVFGLFCTFFFLLLGKWLGTFLFQSRTAGGFIQTLSFICPLLYLCSTLSSILHGLGKTHITFLINLITLTIRLLFVFCAIPLFGIIGYLWGLLTSQLIATILIIIAAYYYTKKAHPLGRS